VKLFDKSQWKAHSSMYLALNKMESEKISTFSQFNTGYSTLMIALFAPACRRERMQSSLPQRAAACNAVCIHH
jgi:hypothetical protein